MNQRLQIVAIRAALESGVQLGVAQMAVAVDVEHVEDPRELFVNGRATSNPEGEQELGVVEAAVVVDVEETKETRDELVFLPLVQVDRQEHLVVDLISSGFPRLDTYVFILARPKLKNTQMYLELFVCDVTVLAFAQELATPGVYLLKSELSIG